MSEEESKEYLKHKVLIDNIKEYFETGTFCDLTIFGQCDEGFQGIKCHSLVICFFIPALKHLIEDNEDKCLFLPEIPFNILSNFVTEIYQELDSKFFELPITGELADVFGIFNDDAYKPKDLVEIVVEQNNANKQNPLELILPDVNEVGMTGTYFVDASNLSEDTTQQLFSVSQEIDTNLKSLALELLKQGLVNHD